MAREFDQLSSEGRTWPTTDFVRWLAAEVRASSEANMTGAERREAA
jgi:hypothetical protein